MRTFGCLIVFLAILNYRSYLFADSFNWDMATPESVGFSFDKLEEMKNILIEKETKKLLIIKNDKIIYQYFAEGWEDSEKNHYSASLAKALVGGMSLAIALNDGGIYPDMPACLLVPEWKKDPKKSQITIRHLATHTSGLEDAEVDDETQRQMRAKDLHPHMDLQGWKGQFWRQEPDPFSVSRDKTKVMFTPGTHFNYSNPGIGMLTYAVTSSLKGTQYSDVRQLLRQRIFEPLGISESEYSIGYDRTFKIGDLALVPSWGGGLFSANAVARIGRLLLKKGHWQGAQIVDPEWVERTTRYMGTALPGDDPKLVNEYSSLRNSSNPFPAATLGWYSNFDGIWPHVPRDTFCGGGAGNQHLFVIPSMDLIIVRMGENLFEADKGQGFWFGAEKHLLNPIMDAYIAPPYPKSDLIKKVTFAPKEEIIRMAKGSDNWPTTWARDDKLYTAYGDGSGFEPKIDMKLSMGFASIGGFPPQIKPENIRTNSGERVGQGKYGPKASGMLSVDGTLYCLARNAGNAQLGWSNDSGRTWQWADWTFEESFGCPTFLNYGRDNHGAKDGFVYIYSQDEPTAYKPADSFVLARVTKGQLKQWRNYEHFAGFNESGRPAWSEDVRKRRPVFKNPAKCYRSDVSYNPGLDRYLWVQIIPLSYGRGPRFQGGIGIFESEHPWGPWKTVYYTRRWDVGPGDSANIPTKWISKDGQTCHLVFSGDDYFSLRKMAIELAE
jgi:CubicO group peptidase (beta-lactamase class C family)